VRWRIIQKHAPSASASRSASDEVAVSCPMFSSIDLVWNVASRVAGQSSRWRRNA